MTVDEIFCRFRRVENSLDCANRTILGFPFWMHLRFHLYTHFIIAQLLGAGNAHPDTAMGRKRHNHQVVKKILRWFRSLLVDRHSRVDVLFALEPRFMPVKGRGRIPIMLDFFWHAVKKNSAVLQYKSGKNLEPMPSGYRYFEARPGWLALHSAKKEARSAEIQQLIEKELEPVIRRLNEEFGLTLPLHEIRRFVTAQMIQYKSLFPTLKKFLIRKRVKRIVTSVNYHPINQVLSDVAHNLSIPVIEMQHGSIDRTHIAYHLPVGCRYGRPDVVLTWGEGWKHSFENYARARLCPVGYPFMEHALMIYPVCRATPPRILFISQGTIGAALSKIAVAIAEEIPEDVATVCYKLHPSETNCWKSIYPWLVESRVNVLDNTACNIYEALATASVIIGVDSTALIEGTAWGLKPIVLTDLPANGKAFADLMADNVIACEGAHLSELYHKIIAVLGSGCNDEECRNNRFFEKDAVSRMIRIFEGNPYE